MGLSIRCWPLLVLWLVCAAAAQGSAGGNGSLDSQSAAVVWWEAHGRNDLREWKAGLLKGNDYVKIDLYFSRDDSFCGSQSRVRTRGPHGACMVLEHTPVKQVTDYNTTDDLVDLLQSEEYRNLLTAPTKRCIQLCLKQKPADIGECTLAAADWIALLDDLYARANEVIHANGLNVELFLDSIDGAIKTCPHIVKKWPSWRTTWNGDPQQAMDNDAAQGHDRVQILNRENDKRVWESLADRSFDKFVHSNYSFILYEPSDETAMKEAIQPYVHWVDSHPDIPVPPMRIAYNGDPAMYHTYMSKYLHKGIHKTIGPEDRSNAALVSAPKCLHNTYSQEASFPFIGAVLVSVTYPNTSTDNTAMFHVTEPVYLPTGPLLERSRIVMDPHGDLQPINGLGRIVSLSSITVWSRDKYGRHYRSYLLASDGECGLALLRFEPYGNRLHAEMDEPVHLPLRVPMDGWRDVNRIITNKEEGGTVSNAVIDSIAVETLQSGQYGVTHVTVASDEDSFCGLMGSVETAWRFNKDGHTGPPGWLGAVPSPRYFDPHYGRQKYIFHTYGVRNTGDDCTLYGQLWYLLQYLNKQRGAGRPPVAVRQSISSSMHAIQPVGPPLCLSTIRVRGTVKGSAVVVPMKVLNSTQPAFMVHKIQDGIAWEKVSFHFFIEAAATFHSDGNKVQVVTVQYRLTIDDSSPADPRLIGVDILPVPHTNHDQAAAAAAAKYGGGYFARGVDPDVSLTLAIDRVYMMVVNSGAFCWNSFARNDAIEPFFTGLKVCDSVKRHVDTEADLPASRVLAYTYGSLDAMKGRLWEHRDKEGQIASACDSELFHGTYDMGRQPLVTMIGNDRGLPTHVSTHVSLRGPLDGGKGGEDCGRPETHGGALVVDSFPLFSTDPQHSSWDDKWRTGSSHIPLPPPVHEKSGFLTLLLPLSLAGVILSGLSWLLICREEGNTGDRPYGCPPSCPSSLSRVMSSVGRLFCWCCCCKRYLRQQLLREEGDDEEEDNENDNDHEQQPMDDGMSELEMTSRETDQAPNGQPSQHRQESESLTHPHRGDGQGLQTLRTYHPLSWGRTLLINSDNPDSTNARRRPDG
ncbi:unnamed protein product [Vitrella brassicaformis CCMP3155]|uniref:Uncharacterized protein n=1 Tax=Vitrella brassicaformis (strain CCMP3155) TaxID=1169540 RepID=A0A0G4GMQ8_VITBC|nr:unnamed protein product [Vitrella brassicaformis CCMP3155]|eukprot:CEM31482.1 unnamed protein product [Vitrella brassicaformis CCMP3155]